MLDEKFSRQSSLAHKATTMVHLSGGSLYGRFEKRLLPAVIPIDKTRSWLPNMINDDELAPFSHPRIDAADQIRLMTLLPPKRNPGPDSMESLRCTITPHTLATAPPFEALSYTWGGIHRHLPISVVSKGSGGEKTEEALFATPQLLMALRRLRATTPRVLWVDQLCIDQDNVAEKGPQIQLMGEIYRRAERVVIWLGEDEIDRMYKESDGQHIADLVTALGNVAEAGTQGSLMEASSLVNFDHSYHYETPELRRGRAVCNMLLRPWFRRAWVFQEAALGRELVVQFGRRQYEFEPLLRMLRAVGSVGNKRRACDLPPTLDARTGGYEMIGIIQRTRLQIRAGTGPGGLAGHRETFLSKLLQVLRRVECYDQRDLIFAFLAFQDREDIVASGGGTEQPVEGVWRHAAERIIATSDSLDIFAAASGDTSKYPLPSWVPNWSNPFPFGRPIAMPGSAFRASRTIRHTWIADDDPGRLRVRGKIIDVIHHVAWRQPEQFPSGCSVWLATSFDCMLKGVKGYLYNNEVHSRLGYYLETKLSNIPRDVVRTLLADGSLGQGPLTNIGDEYAEYFSMESGDRAFGLRASGGTETSAENVAFMARYEEVEDMVRVAEGKFIFFTPHLQLGMAVHEAKVGDAIAILHGSDTPCILRKADENGRGQGEYRLISQCYLNGWMYGASPRELFGKASADNPHPHPHGRWWEEDPDEFILV
ncbi:heterokaryon incompatibility protein-domain-containing protein [Coniochaeta sp. 2T2.1]|nr:heterokaryon incompatibility protein-domain-containing protein [Coniochaeta sp. 2T2.1]